MAKTSSFIQTQLPEVEKTGKLRKSLVLISLGMGYFLVLLDSTIVNVSLPAIGHELGGGMAGLQWVINAYTLVFASLLLTMGALADQFGAKRIFVGGLVVFMLASALAATAPSLGLLVAWRALLGVGAAAIASTSLVIISHEFTEAKERAKAVGVWGAVSGIAFASGPVFGGILVDTLGWHSIFLINVPIALACIVVANIFIHETNRKTELKIDVAGQLSAIIAVAALTFVLIESQTYGWGSPLILSLVGITIIAGGMFLLVEARSSTPMLPLRLFRKSMIWAGMVIGMLINFALAGILFIISLYFQQGMGYSALIAGLAFLPLTLPVAFNPMLTSRLVGRFGAKVPMISGFLLTMGGTLLQATVSPYTGYIVTCIALLLMGFGFSQVIPSLVTAVMSAAAKEEAGIASGVLNSGRQLGAVLGVALLGLILNGNNSLNTGASRALLTTGGVLLAGLVLVACVVRTRKA